MRVPPLKFAITLDQRPKTKGGPGQRTQHTSKRKMSESSRNPLSVVEINSFLQKLKCEREERHPSPPNPKRPIFSTLQMAREYNNTSFSGLNTRSIDQSMESARNSPRIKMFSPTREDILIAEDLGKAFEQQDFLNSTIDQMSSFDRELMGYSVDRPSSKIATEISALGIKTTLSPQTYVQNYLIDMNSI